MRARSIAFIALMGALGNVFGFFPITIPTGNIPVSVVVNFSQLPALLTAVGVGPMEGGFVGLLSTLASTILYIRNPFVPLGNFILGYAAGYFAKKRRPIVSCLLGEVAESPFLWLSMVVWSGVVMGVAFEILLPIIITVNLKAFVEVLADSLVIELLLSREDMKKSLTLFRFD
jgi:riboflavin transporter FmnP